MDEYTLMQSMFRRTEAPLAELLRATTGMDKRARLVLLARDIKAFDAKIRGLRRVQVPDAAAWITLAEGIAELAERCPASLRPALAKTGTYCLERAQELAHQPKTLEQRCSRLLDCRKKGVSPDARFDIALKSVGKDGQRRLAGRASSTAPDRDEDIFSSSAIQSMARDITQVPVFRDHRYGLADVIGKVVESGLTKRNEHTDLDVTIELLPEGDEGADKAWALVESDVPIGLSVGVLIYDSTPRTGKRRGVTFESVEVIDLSVVSIPSQRRSTGLKPVKSARIGSAAHSLRYLKSWKASQMK